METYRPSCIIDTGDCLGPPGCNGVESVAFWVANNLEAMGTRKKDPRVYLTGTDILSQNELFGLVRRLHEMKIWFGEDGYGNMFAKYADLF